MIEDPNSKDGLCKTRGGAAWADKKTTNGRVKQRLTPFFSRFKSQKRALTWVMGESNVIASAPKI